jgi:uncharacterized protein (TIGR02118 family)
MYCLQVIYPNHVGSHFDLAYYVETHMALVQDRLGPRGMLRYELLSGVRRWDPDEPAPFTMICNMYFETREALESAFGSQGPELIADIAAYTDVKPSMQIARVV